MTQPSYAELPDYVKKDRPWLEDAMSGGSGGNTVTQAPNYTGVLGYDPFAGQASGPGPQNIEDWKHDFAMTYTNAWLNGTLRDSALYTGGVFDNVFLAKAGIGPFDPMVDGMNAGAVSGSEGAGVGHGMTYNQMLQLADYIASNWDSLPMEMKTGLSNPSGLGAYEPSLSDDDKSRIWSSGEADKDREFTAGEAAKDREFTAGENAADRAAREAIARLQEDGATARNDARIAGDERIAGLRATVDREAIASQERIAGDDRASREAIARLQEDGLNRRFDLGLAEDRRQFNTGILMGLLDRGIELSRRPVDWIAHQYFMQNMGIPITAISLASSASTFGAIPPTGPSGAGPVSGGPAAMDGDFELAMSIGDTDPGFVSVEQAVAELPGIGNMDAQQWMAQTTIERMGGLEAVERIVETVRQQELPQAIPQSSSVQDFMRRARPGMQDINRMRMGQPQADQAAQMQQAQASAVNAVQGAEGIPPMPMPQMQGQPQMQPPSPEMMQQQAPAPPAPTGSGATGVFTGEATAAPMSAFGAPTGSGAQAPQGIDLLAQLSAQTGIPLEQLQQLVPPELLAGGYSPDVIANSPVIQSLVNNQRLNAFRTAPVEGSQFGEIQAFGIPTGLRGGQDLSASNFLKALPSQQEQMQGAIEATGQYFPDFMSQMLRASPTSNYEVGAFGRRRF